MGGPTVLDGRPPEMGKMEPLPVPAKISLAFEIGKGVKVSKDVMLKVDDVKLERSPVASAVMEALTGRLGLIVELLAAQTKF